MAVTLNGFAKGSGMIAPDMATMLAFVFTDAAMPAPVLQALLSRSARRRFNCITVDGDTSTSDTLLLFATGPRRRAAAEPRRAGDPRLQIVRAGADARHARSRSAGREGRRGRRSSIEITRRPAPRATRRRARSRSPIANSPLVKTAIAGEDANWGRIVMAVGKSGEAADRDRLAIAFGDIRSPRMACAPPTIDEAALVPPT